MYLLRGWYSGCALAFQASETGSIPVPRSRICVVRLMVGPCFYTAETEVQFLHDAPDNPCVAQPGRALALGASGRMFESCHTDQFMSQYQSGLMAAPAKRLIRRFKSYLRLHTWKIGCMAQTRS